MIYIRFKGFSIILIIMLLVLSTACSNHRPKDSENLQMEINDLIISKDESYDFLNDDKYIDLIDNSIDEILKTEDVNPNHFIIGNLSKGNIPEIIFFRERDINNIQDPGYLEIYSYNEDRYTLLDRAPMNYDKTNYQLVLGKVSEDVNGVYLNNYAGSDFGVTYGFILKDNKLISILNPKKVNLISFSDDNKITDCNNNGILEFSISTIDPENYNGNYTKSRVIKYRYGWDGKDGASLVHMEREMLDDRFIQVQSDKEILRQAEKILNSEKNEFLDYFSENKSKLSPNDNSQLIQEYISFLKSSIFLKEYQLKNLLNDSRFLGSSDKLKDEYFISLDLLNDIDYISREKVLSNEASLKEFLISTLKLGYSFHRENDEYLIKINYRYFFDNFKDCIKNEYRDYLRILAHYKQNNLDSLNLDLIAERIVLIENFNSTYPYSHMQEELNFYHDEYLDMFFQGNPSQIGETKLKANSSRFKKKLTDKYKEIKEKYYHSYISDIIGNYLNK